MLIEQHQYISLSHPLHPLSKFSNASFTCCYYYIKSSNDAKSTTWHLLCPFCGQNAKALIFLNSFEATWRVWGTPIWLGSDWILTNCHQLFKFSLIGFHFPLHRESINIMKLVAQSKYTCSRCYIVTFRSIRTSYWSVIKCRDYSTASSKYSMYLYYVIMTTSSPHTKSTDAKNKKCS